MVKRGRKLTAEEEARLVAELEAEKTDEEDAAEWDYDHPMRLIQRRSQPESSKAETK